jgi:hypothetical protein
MTLTQELLVAQMFCTPVRVLQSLVQSTTQHLEGYVSKTGETSILGMRMEYFRLGQFHKEAKLDCRSDVKSEVLCASSETIQYRHTTGTSLHSLMIPTEILKISCALQMQDSSVGMPMSVSVYTRKNGLDLTLHNSYVEHTTYHPEHRSG